MLFGFEATLEDRGRRWGIGTRLFPFSRFYFLTVMSRASTSLTVRLQIASRREPVSNPIVTMPNRLGETPLLSARASAPPTSLVDERFKVGSSGDPADA